MVRAPGQCSEGCELEQQNLPACLYVCLSVCHKNIFFSAFLETVSILIYVCEKVYFLYLQNIDFDLHKVIGFKTHKQKMIALK